MNAGRPRFNFTNLPYRIQFDVSGERTRFVAFDSEADALSIRALDVDHDDDLDIVVSASLSRQTVGVWLKRQSRALYTS